MGTAIEGGRLQLKRANFSDFQNPEMEAVEALSNLRKILFIIEGQDSETVQKLDDLMTAFEEGGIDSDKYRTGIEELEKRMQGLAQSHNRIRELYNLFLLAIAKKDSIN